MGVSSLYCCTRDRAQAAVRQFMSEPLHEVTLVSHEVSTVSVTSTGGKAACSSLARDLGEADDEAEVILCFQVLLARAMILPAESARQNM